MMNRIIQLNDSLQTVIDPSIISCLRASPTLKRGKEEIFFPYVIWFVFLIGDKEYEVHYPYNLDSLEECKATHELARTVYETLKQILLKKYD